MIAAILSIGDELMLGQSVDTNSGWLSARLAELGVACREHRTVGDDRALIASAMRSLREGSDLLLVTGGLGPTADDLTRFALGDVVDPGGDLEPDAEAMADLERWFAGRPGGMPAANRVQAMRPSPATLLANPHGTAPGLRVEDAGGLVVCLPGPPREMRPMFEAVVAPWIRERSAAVLHTAVVPSVGLGESDAAERLGELMDRDRDPVVGTTASGGVVSARIRSAGPGAESRVAAAVEEVLARWHPYAFARESESLAEAVGRRLRAADRRLVTCESCTGGGLGAMLTAVPGSSRWYRGGWITYDNDMKSRHLGVPADLFEHRGAVSAEVAAAMATGGLEQAEADDALAITGIAGPGGGTPGKPVGTVWIAHAARDDGHVRVRSRCFGFRGDRDTVRDRSGTMALAMLRLALDGLESWPPGPPSVPLLWERPAPETPA